MTSWAAYRPYGLMSVVRRGVDENGAEYVDYKILKLSYVEEQVRRAMFSDPEAHTRIRVDQRSRLYRRGPNGNWINVDKEKKHGR